MTDANMGALLRFPTTVRYLTLATLVAAQPTPGAGYRWGFARVTTGGAPADSSAAVIDGVTVRYWRAGSQLFVLYGGKLYVYQAYAPLTAAARVRTIAGHPYAWDASLGMWSLQSLGQTNPNFAPPTGLDATTASANLLTALNNLLQDFTNNGIPSEHTYNASTAAFQTAWNAEPAVMAAGANAQLSVDGAYGNNAHDAVAAVNGGSAYDVNTAAAPTTPTVPTTPTTPTTPATNTTTNTTTTTTTTTTSSTGLIIGALVLGAAIVGGTVYYHHGGGKQMLARRRARRALSHHTVHHAHG